MSNVLIVGTGHDYQRETQDVASGDLAQFREYLKEMVGQFSVIAIAEEMSDAALKENGLSSSVAQALSEELGLMHDLSDPGPDERMRLGVRGRNDIEQNGFLGNKTRTEIDNEIRQSYAIREEYWVSRLAELGSFPVLFICGSTHVEFLHANLLSKGYNSIILVEKWEPS